VIAGQLIEVEAATKAVTDEKYPNKLRTPITEGALLLGYVSSLLASFLRHGLIIR
jgi:hypothetical protein